MIKHKQYSLKSLVIWEGGSATVEQAYHGGHLELSIMPYAYVYRRARNKTHADYERTIKLAPSTWKCLHQRGEERAAYLKGLEEYASRERYTDCVECGARIPEAKCYGGRCPECHLATIGQPGGNEQFILAGAELPLAEVFSQQEIKRLEFYRHLVQVGKLSEQVEG